MNKQTIIAAALSCLLLNGCGAKESSAENEMQYIKTSVLYDTIMDMYSNPDNYLGRQFHMVGQLYPSTHGDEQFYSIYAKPTSGGDGIGLELEWSDFSGLEDFDTITVEGTLEQRTGSDNGSHYGYMVLKVSSLEKRD